MRWTVVLAALLAVMLHGGFILFGGLLLPKAKQDQGTARQVELIGPEAAPDKKDPKKEKAPEEKNTEQDVAKTKEEPPPDVEKMIRSFEATEPQAAALELVDLSAIEAALSGKGGEGWGGDAVAFIQGGRIDGHGRGTVILADAAGAAMDLSEIDQQPRVIFQPAAQYPSEMHGKKIDGTVTVLFVVDATGKVTRQRVEQSNYKAFEQPALDAVKRWKFEPGIKGGQRVPCKTRVTVRFSAS